MNLRALADQITAAELDRNIAGEEATIRIYRRQVTDIRAAWRAWKRSGLIFRSLALCLGDARYARVMWRKHRSELMALKRRRALLDVPYEQERMRA